MDIAEIEKLRILLRSKDWSAAHDLLDGVRSRAATREDRRSEIYWRATALEREQRYEEAIGLVRKNRDLYNSQSLAHHEIARCLIKLGRDQEALDELSQAPIEAEMQSHYGLAIDAKFFYFYLRAKSGDQTVKDQLAEIPDDYRYIGIRGKFLTKSDIAALLDKATELG